MIYTPIQEMMPSRCHECRDDACKHWERDNPLEERHPECPLVEMPSREEAEIILGNLLVGRGNQSEILDKLGFKVGK